MRVSFWFERGYLSYWELFDTKLSTWKPSPFSTGIIVYLAIRSSIVLTILSCPLIKNIPELVLTLQQAAFLELLAETLRDTSVYQDTAQQL